MITEVFMIPSYIMGHLIKIKNEFPHIKFIETQSKPDQSRRSILTGLKPSSSKEEHIDWLETQLLQAISCVMVYDKID